jgi:hypothetical protein
MSSLSTAPAPTASPPSARPAARARRLPRWTPIAVFGAALAVVVLLDLMFSLNVAL